MRALTIFLCVLPLLVAPPVCGQEPDPGSDDRGTSGQAEKQFQGIYSGLELGLSATDQLGDIRPFLTFSTGVRYQFANRLVLGGEVNGWFVDGFDPPAGQSGRRSGLITALGPVVGYAPDDSVLYSASVAFASADVADIVRSGVQLAFAVEFATDKPLRWRISARHARFDDLNNAFGLSVGLVLDF